MRIRYTIQLILLVLLVFSFKAEGSSSVFINEFMASNSETIADEDGDFEDWIELYNTGQNALNLKGFHLSDDLDEPYMWAFPDTTIEAGEFLLVFASGKNRSGKELHTNFRISRDGEPLLLTDADGLVVDFIEPVEVPTDISYGRLPDGAESFKLFSVSTPGYSNQQGEIYILPKTTITFSADPGFYTENFKLELFSDVSEDLEIYYTLDGSLPDKNSLLYEGGIELKSSNDLEPNPIIFIPTTSPNGPSNFIWRSPITSGFAAQVVRARAYRGDTVASEVQTGTYFISEYVKERFSLPVISISLPEGALFDADTGIYIAGTTYENNPDVDWHWGTGNFHRRGDEWERTANFEFFETDFSTALNQVVGLRIHGGGSRALPLKSFRIYARNQYGNNVLEHQFFEGDTLTQFRRLILRNSGQDFRKTMLKDALTHEILSEVDIEKQKYRPAVVFVNGAYWGIMNIRERMDKHFLSDRRGVDPDNVDLLEFSHTVVEGDSLHYLFMMDYVRNNPIITEQRMEVLKSLMDVDNFIDYYIAKLYLGVYDWPGNNIRFWRERKTGGVWRWIYFDNDDAFEDPKFNSLIHATNDEGYYWPNPVWSTELFRLLLESPIFTEMFVNRFAFHLENTFSKERFGETAVRVIRQIEDEIPYHIQRWQYPKNESEWKTHINKMLSFIEKRPCLMREMLIDFFQLSETYLFNLCERKDEGNINVYPNPSHGEVKVVISQESVSYGNLNVYNMLGQNVYSKQVLFSPGEITMDVFLPGHLPSGAYVIRVQIHEKTMLARLMLF